MDAFLLEKCSESLVNGAVVAEKLVDLLKSHAQPTPFRYIAATERLGPYRKEQVDVIAGQPDFQVWPDFSFAKARLYSIWPLNSRKARFR